jgi:hypothetical protein
MSYRSWLRLRALHLLLLLPCLLDSYFITAGREFVSLGYEHFSAVGLEMVTYGLLMMFLPQRVDFQRQSILSVFDLAGFLFARAIA